MIVWLNGTFGVGKTTTANLLSGNDGWRMFDPEHVGYLLAGNLDDLDFDDFQDLRPWRTLVPVVADEIHRLTRPAMMVAVQSVLVERYWRELVSGFAQRGHRLYHVLLDCEPDELRRRIESDELERQALQWRLDHMARFARAKRWMTEAADLVVDTTGVPVETVAAAVTEAASRAGSCG